MPSIDAPTHYDRSAGLMKGALDDFFKWALVEYSPDDTGDVESPIGFVSLIEVTLADIVEYCDRPEKTRGNVTEFLTLTKEHGLDPGWYICRQDNNGLIFAMTYGGGTLAEEKARADFTEAEKVYASWSDAVGIDPDEDTTENEQPQPQVIHVSHENGREEVISWVQFRNRVRLWATDQPEGDGGVKVIADATILSFDDDNKLTFVVAGTSYTPLHVF